MFDKEMNGLLVQESREHCSHHITLWQTTEVLEQFAGNIFHSLITIMYTNICTRLMFFQVFIVNIVFSLGGVIFLILGKFRR